MGHLPSGYSNGVFEDIMERNVPTSEFIKRAVSNGVEILQDIYCFKSVQMEGDWSGSVDTIGDCFQICSTNIENFICCNRSGNQSS